MKKEKKPNPQLQQKSILLKAFMMLAFSLYCFAVSAQSGAAKAKAIAPEKATVENASNSKVAEFVKNNPSDGQAQQALKYAMILDNPAAFPEFSQSDIDRMKSEQISLMNRINFMEQQMKDGVDYDKAGALYQREMDRKAALDNVTNPNKTVQQPATDTAPMLINGNN